MKLPSILNVLFPWRPIDSKIKVSSILKKHEKKTVIFLIFADIKRHNFKYTGEYYWVFGLRNAVSFIRKYFSLDFLPPLKLRKHISSPPKKIRRPKKII